MLKLGVVRADALDRTRTWFGKQKHASLLLLRDLHLRGSCDGAFYDAILRLVTLPNGTWRDTTKHRLTAVDRALLEILESRLPAGRRLRILDVGASSGATSADLYRLLSRAYSIEMIATDLWRDAIAVAREGSGVHVILDSHGEELQYVVGPFVLPGQGSESALYAVNRALLRLCRARLLGSARAALRHYHPDHHRDFETRRGGGYEITRIPLLSSECLDLLRTEPAFRFEVADVRAPFRHGADVIRAMNILTPAHFEEDALRHGIRNCLAALDDGGLFVTGRSPSDDPNEVRATIYAAKEGRLQPVRKLNGGSEIDPFVLETEVGGHPGRRPLRNRLRAPLLRLLRRGRSGEVYG